MNKRNTGIFGLYYESKGNMPCEFKDSMIQWANEEI